MVTPVLYPNFKNITLEDRDIFERKTHDFYSYSDFNLLSLLSWNSGMNNAYAILNDNLVLRIKDYLSDKYVFSIIGKIDLESSFKKLLADFGQIQLVPEQVINLLENEKDFDISEDRDNFDYLLSLEKLTKFEGSEFKSLRRNISRFEDAYEICDMRVLSNTKDTDIELILRLTETWCISKGFDRNKLAEEVGILKNFLEFSKEFNCVILGLFHQEKLIAYTANEIVSKDVIMGHFGAALKEYIGGAHFMEHITAQYFLAQGYSLLNHQQDTGIKNLREAKMVYKPVEFLKKYTVTLAK